MVCCTAGVVVVAHPPFLFGGMHWSAGRLLGMALGVNFCLFSAAVAFTIRRIGRSEHTLTIALWFHTSIVVFTGIALAAGWPQTPLLPRKQDILPLAGIVATTYLAQLAMTRALQITPVATVAALAFMGVIWGHVLGAAFLGEPSISLQCNFYLLFICSCSLPFAYHRCVPPR
jgi:drug/metabolite transporter (DMT)-like permease